MDRRHRYLIFGMAREQIADALLEYRRFAAANPNDPDTPLLLHVSHEVRLALRAERAVMRSSGETGKPNAQYKLTPTERRKLQATRRRRLVPRS